MSDKPPGRGFEMSPFDPRKMDMEGTVMILGRPKKGKSFLLRYICRMIQSVHPPDMVVAFCGNKDSEKDLREMLPGSLIYQGFQEDKLEAIIKKQEEFMAAGGYVPHVVIIMDDLGFDRKSMSNKSMKNVFMNGRHMNILLFCCVQYIMSMPIELRNSVTYSMAAYDLNVRTRKAMYESLFSALETFTEFNVTWDHLRSQCKFGFLVQSNTGANDSLDGTLFYIEAKPTKRFCFGSRDMWKLHNRAERGQLGAGAGALPAPQGPIKSVLLKRKADDDDGAGSKKRSKH